MPYDCNESAKSSIKGLEKYSDSEVTAFRKAFNSAYKKCKNDNGSDCDSYAARVGWSALKQSKNEAQLDALTIRVDNLQTALEELTAKLEIPPP